MSVATHTNPTFKAHKPVCRCATNMPEAVPNTSIHALTNVTLRYMVALANLGAAAARLAPHHTAAHVRRGGPP